MKTVVRWLDQFNRLIGSAVSWGTLAMVLLTFTVVVLRYLFEVGWIWMQEAVLYLHSLVFLLAAGSTLDRDGHVRVDVFYRRGTPRKQALVDLAGTLFLLLPVCGLIFWQASPFVADSWRVKESSPEPGGLPGVFLLKSLILGYAGLLVLSGIRMAIHSGLVLSKGRAS